MQIEINSPGGLHDHEVFGGYYKKEKPTIVTQEDQSLLAWDVRRNFAYWGGRPRETFFSRLSGAGEGEDFRWNNARYIRMTSDEISGLIDDKVFQLHMPPFESEDI